MDVPVEGLIEGLKSVVVLQRYFCVRALAELAPMATPAVSALAKAVDDENDHVRYVACETLGKMGPPATPAVPALIRAIAAQALGEIGPTAESAIAALTRAIADEDKIVWRYAENALRNVLRSPEM